MGPAVAEEDRLFRGLFLMRVGYEIRKHVKGVSHQNVHERGTLHVARGQATLRCYFSYKKCGDVHEKFRFLENTRLKTLEHLLKTF